MRKEGAANAAQRAATHPNCAVVGATEEPARAHVGHGQAVHGGRVARQVRLDGARLEVHDLQAPSTAHDSGGLLAGDDRTRIRRAARRVP